MKRLIGLCAIVSGLWAPAIANANISLHSARMASQRLMRSYGQDASMVHLCSRSPRLGCWVTVPPAMQNPDNPVLYARTLVVRFHGRVIARLSIPRGGIR